MSTIVKLFLVFVVAVLCGASYMVYKIKHTTPTAAAVVVDMPSMVITTTTQQVKPGTTL